METLARISWTVTYLFITVLDWTDRSVETGLKSFEAWNLCLHRLFVKSGCLNAHCRRRSECSFIFMRPTLHIEGRQKVNRWEKKHKLAKWSGAPIQESKSRTHLTFNLKWALSIFWNTIIIFVQPNAKQHEDRRLEPPVPDPH